MRPLIGLLLAIACAALPEAESRRPLAAPAGPDLPGEAVKIGENRYRLGKLTIDLASRTATCSGAVNMDREAIEYFAVAPGGKLHESLLRLDVRPLHLQLGLILLGMEPKGGLEQQGDSRLPLGSPVSISVSWVRALRRVRAQAEQMIWDITRKQPMPRGAWVFSGSRIDADGFVADRELSLIASYRDPAAIINNALPTGSDDAAYKANLRVVPPVKTPVTVTFQAVPPPTSGP